MALSFFSRGMTQTSRAGTSQPEVEPQVFFCCEIRTSRRQSTSGHIDIHLSHATGLRGDLSLPWSSSDIPVLGTGDAPKLKQMETPNALSSVLAQLGPMESQATVAGWPSPSIRAVRNPSPGQSQSLAPALWSCERHQVHSGKRNQKTECPTSSTNAERSLCGGQV